MRYNSSMSRVVELAAYRSNYVTDRRMTNASISTKNQLEHTCNLDVEHNFSYEQLTIRHTKGCHEKCSKLKYFIQLNTS